MIMQANQVTADELFAMPDDGFRYERVRGELKQLAPAGEEHGRITVEISLPLGNRVKACHLGKVYAAETGFKLASDPDTVRVTVYRSRREIHVLTEDDAVSNAEVVPGWSLPLHELFG